MEGSKFIHYEPNNFEPEEKLFKLCLSPMQLEFESNVCSLLKIRFIAWGCHTALLKGVSVSRLHLGSVDCYLTLLFENDEMLNLGSKEEGLAKCWVENLKQILNIPDDFDFISKQFAILKN